MAFHPFEVSTPHVIYTLLGGFVVLFGMFSLFLREKLYIGEACWAFLFGIAMGPYGANLFDPYSWGGSEAVTNSITIEFTRVVLAIGVFAIGVELPKAYMARHWKSIFFLLGPIMTWGWFVSAGLIKALIPSLNFRSSLVIAACLTPTDPILAAAVVGGRYADKHVPAHIRHLLAAESACNDGAAFPFLFIALYLIIDSPNTGKAIGDWFLLLWLYQIALGVTIGALVGFGFRHLMKFCEARNLIDRHSYVAQYVSLAIFVNGVTVLLGSDDLLASFACGTAFAWDGFFNRQTEASNFSSVIDLLFNIAAFIFVGAWMPFDMFTSPDIGVVPWRLVVIAILVLLLRRLPVMMALYRWIPDIKTFREAIFVGHFGPMGIGAVFIATLAAEVLEKNADMENEQTETLIKALRPIVAFMVLVSVLVHGLSIPSFSLGKRVHSVSRTWSRHTGGADWANEIPVVDRGDARIVVNRDSEMEKGEAGTQDGSTSDQPSGSDSVTEVGGSQRLDLSEEDRIKSTRADPPTMEEVSEWQEGPDTVVERRMGPGEEVEVEVIRNTQPSRPHSPEGVLSRAVHRYTTPHTHTQNILPSSSSDLATQTTPGPVKHGKVGSAPEVDRGQAESCPSGSQAPSRVLADGHDLQAAVVVSADDDEGWASDDSGPQPHSSPLSRSDSQRRQSGSRSPRSTARRGTGRRRGSNTARHGGLDSQLLAALRSSNTAESIANGGGFSSVEGRRASASVLQQGELSPSGERGRTSNASPARTAPLSPGLRNARLDQLRRSVVSSRARDASPARSIRFADEDDGQQPRSGVTTPRTPRTPNNELALDLDEA